MALDTFITFPAVDVAGPPTAVERSGRIDVFSVGGSKLLHWWWDQLCWRGPQDCGGNLPAEGVAAVVGGREEIYVYAVDANGQLLGWMFQDNAARPPLITGPVVISSPGLPSHPPAAALYDGRMHVFAVSRGGVFEGGQLLHWASELATASEPANGLRFAATFSDPSGPFRNPEAFGVTRDSRIARWRFDGSAWHEVAALVPNDWADTLRPSVAVVARNQRLEVFAVGNQSRASSQVTTGIEHWTPDAAGAAAAFHSPTDGLSPTGDDILAVARGQDIHVVVPGSRFAVTFPQSGPVVETALPYLEYACAVAARAHVESHPGPLAQRRDQVVLDYLTTRGDHGTWDGSTSMPPSILLHLPGATGTMAPALVSLANDCLDAFSIDANGRLIHWFII